MRRSRLLLVGLLAFALVNPVAGMAGTAAAGDWVQTGCGGSPLEALATDFFTVGNKDCHQSEEINTAQEQNAIEDEQTLTDLKAWAASQRAHYKAFLAVRSNYLNDSRTVAWSKAEAAMVEAMKANKTEAEIRAAGVEAIRDYYARQQVNVIESWDGTLAAAEYINEVAANETGLSDNDVTMAGQDWTGNTQEVSITLVNGSTHPSLKWVKPDGSGTIVNGSITYSGTVLDDFEDGDVSEWSKTSDSGSGGGFTTTTAWAAEGSTAGYLTSGGDVSAEVWESSIPSQGYQNLTFHINPQNLASSGNIQVQFREKSNNNRLLQFTLSNDGTASVGGNTIGTLSTGTAYKVELYNIDYTSETYDAKITNTDTGTVVGTVTGIAFAHSGSDTIGKLYVQASANNDAYLDFFAEQVSKDDQTSIYVDDGSDDEVIVNFDDYEQHFDEMQNTSEQVVANFKPYANKSIDAWQNGTFDPEDYLSPSTLMQEYTTQFEDTGYWTYAVTALSSAGLQAPSLNNTSHMVVRYDSAVNDSRDGQYKGLLMSQNGPTYPSDSDKTDGRWYSGYNYSTSNINGSVLLVTWDGQQITLNGTFEIVEMYDRDGNEIASVDTREVNYETTNTTKLEEKLDKLANLRAELESLQLKLLASDDGGSGDSGGLFDGLGLGGLFSGNVFGFGLGIGHWILIGGGALLLTRN
jgi:hypothetical protein